MATTLLSDFDGTVFHTSTPPLGGLDVEGAYRLAVGAVLGEESLKLYLSGGGLKNRSPHEVVRSLRMTAKPQEVQRLTEELVAAKLGPLLNQIGTQSDGSIWPPPCAGFLAFWERVSELREEGRMQTAIVSMGHRDFIERVWGCYNLRSPDVLVTYEDLPKNMTAATEMKFVKPSKFSLNLALGHLERLSGRAVNRRGLNQAPSALFCGDDLVRDGKMAVAAQVVYGHFDPAKPFAYTLNGFTFPSWSDLTPHLPGAPGFIFSE